MNLCSLNIKNKRNLFDTYNKYCNIKYKTNSLRNRTKQQNKNMHIVMYLQFTATICMFLWTMYINYLHYHYNFEIEFSLFKIMKHSVYQNIITYYFIPTFLDSRLNE